jgi:uncharacterized protein YdeI (YjbR/CyaY-like superfamily)
MNEENIDIFYPENRQQWRQWLQENHDVKHSVWLLYFKKSSNKPSLSWSDAVDEALCFGWIDSKRQTIDEEKFRQYFCRRKPKSTWSKINKDKIERLTEEGLMAQAGFDSIETAKLNGSWSILDEVENLIIPEDLEKAFQTRAGSKSFFLNLSRSDRRAILQWLVLAKREQTRQKRIQEIAELAGQGLKPRQFR